MKDKIDELEEEEPATAQRKHKVKALTLFGGDKHLLEGFLVQLRVYINHHKSTMKTEADKVICAATFLCDKALAWFQPILKDYLDNDDHDDREGETNEIFDKYTEFEDWIRTIFGEPDPKRSVVRQLQQLRQVRSASEYAATFNTITAPLRYDDEPLMDMFYLGLKDAVKDELSKADRPGTIGEFMQEAIKIDDRQWERRQEKKRS